jgi:hypothetical protein
MSLAVESRQPYADMRDRFDHHELATLVAVVNYRNERRNAEMRKRR